MITLRNIPTHGLPEGYVFQDTLGEFAVSYKAAPRGRKANLQKSARLAFAMVNALAVPLFALGAFASLAAAQCPQVHVFGARETTAPPGFGSAGPVVDMVLSSVPGSTAEVINYPACGGQASCGGISYAQSVIDGVNAVASQVNTFNAECPNTVLVLIGYSQVSRMGPSGPSGRLWGETDK